MVLTPRVTLWILRLLLGTHLIAVLVQAVLAGRYMTGDIDAITTHDHLGSRLLLIGGAVAGAALGYVLIVRGRWWVPAAAVLLFLADWAEITIGRLRGLDIHLPLGITIALGAALFFAWSWTPAAARPREPRRARVGAGTR